MPQMDGFEATRRIRAINGEAARVPIIALTANTFATDRRRCLDSGMDDYLSKPLQVEALRAAIERWAPSPAASVQPNQEAGSNTDSLSALSAVHDPLPTETTESAEN
jgi:DNA-binding response OmpR family regulator